MDLGLRNKSVFLAGSSRGIGRAIAEAFLAEGANVMLTARSANTLQSTAAELQSQYGDHRVLTFAGDMAATEDIEAAVQASLDGFGELHCAIANVGIEKAPHGLDLNDEQWEAGLNQNLGSAFKLARAVVPHLDGRAGGNMVMISSIAGMQTIGAKLSYGPAKSGMNHLCRELARMFGPQGIRFNAVSPGMIMFPGSNLEALVKEAPDDWAHRVKRDVPMQRFGRPEEVAAAVVFAASMRASFMSGAVVPVDGGHLR